MMCIKLCYKLTKLFFCKKPYYSCVRNFCKDESQIDKVLSENVHSYFDVINFLTNK